jgi:hypothetical protein
MQEFSGVLGSWIHSENENSQTPAAEVGKIFFVEREEESCMGACRGTQKPVAPWVRLEIGFL